MINYTLIHPGLLAALAESGHGSQILIADANYPHNTGAPAAARRIALNLRPGLLTVDQILEVLIDAVPVEARFDFYDAAHSPHVAVVIAGGDTRHYANLLLTIGVKPDGTL
jgi:L-fucose mutarotase